MYNISVIQTKALLFSTLLLLTALCLSVPSSAQVDSAEGTPPVSVEQLAQVLWDQTANISTAGAASQNFTDPGGGFDSFDSRAADDFNIPGPAGWNIQTLRAIGFYSGGPGPVQSLNVVFFADAAGLPGDVIPGCEYRNIPPTNINDPDFVINLPVACELLPGTYWVSVEANMPFIPNGQWFWFYQTVQTLNLFAWENPLDGFGDGCTAWTPGISWYIRRGGRLELSVTGRAVQATPSRTDAQSVGIDRYRWSFGVYRPICYEKKGSAKHRLISESRIFK